jgi:hypothetical protein
MRHHGSGSLESKGLRQCNRSSDDEESDGICSPMLFHACDFEIELSNAY